jgi:DtxR family transcriptional regulator, Mn-dependent transcriptional regulator
MDVTSRARQDYLKVIYALTTSGHSVTNGLLARELGVSPPSVSAMVKRLTGEELLQRPHGRLLRLTGTGEHAALQVIRRHRLLEAFLAQVLGMPWDEVHAEAESLEHAVSERLEERIDAVLGHPERDPHGDPIPPRHGPHDETWGEVLDSAVAGCCFRVDRVSDRDSAALRYLGELGIAPGVVLEVGQQEPFSGPRWIRIDDKRHALGGRLTKLVHGHVLPKSTRPAANAVGARDGRA